MTRDLAFTPRSTRKHRVGRARVRQAVYTAYVVAANGHGTNGDPLFLFLGDDNTGRALEVVAAETADGNLIVIHAMDLRPKYRKLYEQHRPR